MKKYYVANLIFKLVNENLSNLHNKKRRDFFKFFSLILTTFLLQLFSRKSFAIIPFAFFKKRTDTFKNNVSLLLRFDGSHGATTFTDSSPNPKALSIAGTVNLTTSNYKFGTASLNLTANGSSNYDNYLTMTNADNAFVFGTGDFTVEAWINLAGPSAVTPGNIRDAQIICYFPTGSEVGWMFGLGGTSTLTGNGFSFIYSATGNTSSPSWYGAVTASYNFSYGQWYHMAASRSGTTTYLFVNGTLINSGTLPDNNIVCNADCRLNIGERPWGNNYKFPFNGYIDEVRITKGIARYTSNFTPSSIPN
jgi:hypothetical protein